MRPIPVSISRRTRAAECRETGPFRAMLYSRPNIPVERTAHSAGIVVVPGLGFCGSLLTAGVRPYAHEPHLRRPRIRCYGAAYRAG